MVFPYLELPINQCGSSVKGDVASSRTWFELVKGLWEGLHARVSFLHSLQEPAFHRLKSRVTVAERQICARFRFAFMRELGDALLRYLRKMLLLACVSVEDQMDVEAASVSVTIETLEEMLFTSEYEEVSMEVLYQIQTERGNELGLFKEMCTYLVRLDIFGEIQEPVGRMLNDVIGKRVEMLQGKFSENCIEDLFQWLDDGFREFLAVMFGSDEGKFR